MKKEPRSGSPNSDELTYEFTVQDPWGLTAVEGYLEAARHFGLNAMEDPSTDGGDTYRLLIHRSVTKLRQAGRILARAHSSEDDARIEKAEEWLALESGVHWFHHDWRYWDQEQDEGALEQLGWERVVKKTRNGYRVTLRSLGPRRPAPARRGPGRRPAGPRASGGASRGPGRRGRSPRT